MEKNIVEQSASDQWKLARLERYEGRLFGDNIPNPNGFAKSVNTFYLCRNRLQHPISHAIRDLERYRKLRHDRDKFVFQDRGLKSPEACSKQTKMANAIFWVLPYVLGLDKKWRTIPREVMGDFCGRPRTERGPVGPDGPTAPVPGYDSPEDIPPGEDEK